MYTVLLVDDEQIVLDFVKENIAWQQLGVETVLTAGDGAQALACLKQREVDLVITDIRMPHMDGFALLRQLRLFHPGVHCILLSAYSDFEYARQALTLGVENYLLKPVQINELEETIEKALDNLYARQKNTEFLFRNNILNRWAAGTIRQEELSERADLLNLNLYLPEYMAVIIRKRAHGVSLVRYRQKAAETLGVWCEAYLFLSDQGDGALILAGQKLDAGRVGEHLARMAEAMGLSEAVAVALGTVVDHCESLPASYQAAAKNMDLADFTAPGFLLLSGDADLMDDGEGMVEAVRQAYQESDVDARAAAYRSIARMLCVYSSAKEAFALLEKLSQAMIHLLVREFPGAAGIQKQVYDHLIHFDANPSEERFQAAAGEILENGFFIYRSFYERLSPIVQLTVTYIRENFAQSISLKEFCVKNRVNAAYLGYLFKNEMGLYFNNYLSRYRIGRSMRLLRDTNRKIGDIARDTGFGSSSYFIQCFKNQIGVPPVAYRAAVPPAESGEDQSE